MSGCSSQLHSQGEFVAGEKRELGDRTKSLVSWQAGGDGGVARQLRGRRCICDDKIHTLSRGGARRVGERLVAVTGS